MNIEALIASRMLKGQASAFFTLTGWVSLGGLILGVACLFVSMAVMSGFESTLQKSVTDVTGHIQILKYNLSGNESEDLVALIKKQEPTLAGAVRFNILESVLAHGGQISGVLVQGVDGDKINTVLGLQNKIVAGKLDIENQNAVIGKGLAKNFNLKVGDTFKVVYPVINELNPNQFRRNIKTFTVAGILNLGKFDFDERMVITNLAVTQDLAQIGSKYLGLYLRFDNAERGLEISQRLASYLGPSYRVRTWKDINENLFEAVKLERVVIFFVILVIVIAAAFNVASALYIGVVRKYNDIAILKTLGFSQRSLIRIFSLQGLILGLIGLLGGVSLGAILCWIFSWAQEQFDLIPGSIYKIDHIQIQIRAIDLAAITVATLFICFIATLAPAFRGSRLKPVDGLKNG